MPRHLPWHYLVNPVITSEDFLLCISGRNLRGKIHARSCSGSSANPSKVWLHPDPPFPRNSPLQELVSLGLPIPPGGYFTSKPTPKAGQGTHPQPHARGPTQGTSRRGPLLWGNCAPCVLYPRCLHPRVVPGCGGSAEPSSHTGGAGAGAGAAWDLQANPHCNQPR